MNGTNRPDGVREMVKMALLMAMYAPAKIRVFMPVRRCYSLAGALVKTTGVGWRSRRE